MSTVPAIPQQISFTSNLGNDFQTKLVPRNADNSIFDCTNYSVSPTLKYLPQQGNAAAGTPLSLTPTVEAHDATGITIKIAAAALATAAAALYGMPAQFSFEVTDSGTNVLLAAFGQMTISQNPSNPL